MGWGGVLGMMFPILDKTACSINCIIYDNVFLAISLPIDVIIKINLDLVKGKLSWAV